jgi:hypothetical protein
MHLHHPSLSLNGKYRGKKKFRNADEARKARELEEEWKSLQKKWGIEQEGKKKKSAAVLSTSPAILPNVYRRETGPRIPSIDTGVKGAVTVKPTPHYTGENLVGIAVMHKSCLQPIFNQQQAIDSATMRRG